MEKKTNYAYIDIIRIASMFMVVFLHSAAAGLRTHLGGASWQILNAFTSIFTAAVPLFFMISGAVVLDSPNTCGYEVTLKKRLPRLIIPLIAWSVVAAVWTGVKSSDLSVFLKILTVIPTGEAAIHLWFMYTLIPLYMISPLLKAMVDSASRRTLEIGLLLWVIALVLGTIEPFLPENLKFLTQISAFSNMKLFGGYLGFFLLGYYLHRYPLKINIKWVAAITCATAVIIALGTWAVSSESYVEQFKSYRSAYVIVLSCGIFLIARRLFDGKTLPRQVKTLSALSFGVYLSHNIFISVLYNIFYWNVSGFSGTSALFAAFCFTVTCVVCGALTFALSKINPLRFAFTGL
ncbi:membrane protein [Clostridia bacterium]|nr:membrane protein [Clostridia bacterium]